MSLLEKSPTKLVIRGVPISPPIALAPMVGLSHSAMRTLLLERGGVGLFFTEMLTAGRLPHDNPGCSPLLMRQSREWPLFFQIVTADHHAIGAAVEKIHQLHGQGIDLNCGCPAPFIKKQGAGLALLDNRPELQKILSTLRNCTELPISVKIRLGRQADSTPLRQLCRFFEGEGVDLITIHARLDGEKFCRRPRWSLVSEVIGDLSLPVFVNGGIFTLEDARRCLEQSGAIGLMIGRGAIRNPHLCSEIAENLFGVVGTVSPGTEQETFFRFFSLLEERFSPERRLGRLKQFTAYFAEPLLFGHRLKSAVQASSSMAEAAERAESFFHQCRKTAS